MVDRQTSMGCTVTLNNSETIGFRTTAKGEIKYSALLKNQQTPGILLYLWLKRILENGGC